MSPTVNLIKQNVRDMENTIKNIYNQRCGFVCIGTKKHLIEALNMLGYNKSQQTEICNLVTLWGAGMGKYDRVYW